MLTKDKVDPRVHSKVDEWNRMKAEDPDRIILMEISGFYEFYAEDADTMCAEFKVPTMGGTTDCTVFSGMPLISYEKYTKKLTACGYRFIVI